MSYAMLREALDTGGIWSCFAGCCPGGGAAGLLSVGAHTVWPPIAEFWTFWMGGSFGFSDPKSGIGVVYTMSRMGTDLAGDSRNMALIAAIYSSL